MVQLLVTLMLSSSPDAGAYAGTLDRQAFAKAIRARWPTVKRCFEQPEGSSGRIIVRFVIGPDGHVTEAELAQPTTFPNDIVACVLKAVKPLKTEPPSGGAALVMYPFIIHTTGF